MEKRSIFLKVMVLVLMALLIPAVASATPACEPPYCGPCDANQYDCTGDWIWNNMYAALLLWANGYTIIVCCE